jgi:hypothetical protein
MAIDIQTIRDGKIAKTFHMENWLSALGHPSDRRAHDIRDRAANRRGF